MRFKVTFDASDRVAETIKTSSKSRLLTPVMKWRTLVRLWCGWSTTTRSVCNDQKFEIVYRDPADLIPYEMNAKKHDEQQIEI